MTDFFARYDITAFARRHVAKSPAFLASQNNFRSRANSAGFLRALLIACPFLARPMTTPKEEEIAPS